MKHKPRRENDEWYCPRCHKRWDVKEPPPGCVDKKEISLARREYLEFIKGRFIL